MSDKYNGSGLLDELSLGKQTVYESEYNPSLLQAVPRSLNRDDLNLSSPLPFKGQDLWTGYELSWLNDKGKPQVALAEFVVPAYSPNLIESKSFKLYLNSFNQSKFGNWQEVTALMEQDLSACAGEAVTVNLISVQSAEQLQISSLPGECIDDLDVTIDNYEFSNLILENSTSNKKVSKVLHSHLLKSNCLITSQPDWASIVIEYQGNEINEEALLKYLISFRMHNEFHEQCVERIYTDLQRFCNPNKLSVYARYTRRGGLDINPFRSSELTTIPYKIRTNRQ